MNLSILKRQIKDFALDVGIDKIGFTDADPLLEHLPRLIERKEADYKYAFNEGDPERRVNPLAHLPRAASVISVAVAYTGTENDAPESHSSARGRMSLISRGQDYHAVVRNKLDKLQQFILSFVPEAQVVPMVDRAEILEKAIAVKAGLGWFGKNTLLVTPEYGSLVCLGELVTDIPFPPDRPLEIKCGSCRECVAACPTNALDEGSKLNPDRCLAGLTQYKNLSPADLRDSMSNLLYGCDTCQTVCPFNQKARTHEHPEFAGEPEDCFPVLTDILVMTNAEFKRRFGLTSGAWRGRTPIQRNAAIAAGNLGDVTAVPILIKIMFSDTRPTMRAISAWALGKIGAPDGKKALTEARKTEKHPEVIIEIEAALGMEKKGSQ